MNEARLLDTFLDLIGIDSPSGHEGEVAKYCEKALREAGCTVTIDGSAPRTGSDTGNVIATLPGTSADPRRGALFIAAHMDNVDPCRGVKPVISDGVVRSDGTTVLGADDKVGVACAIEAIRSLAEGDDAYPDVSVIFSVAEESGLRGAQNTPDDLFDGELVLVCDGDDAPGTVTIASAHQYAFTITFIGRAAHAGVAPERGISAIEMASAAISGMELGRIDEGTTANIGSIEGGHATNIVADRCQIVGECRAMTMERLDEVKAQIEGAVELAVASFQGDCEQEWVKSVEGFSYDEDDDMVQQVLVAADSIGLPPQTNFSCGATDGNCYALHGARPVELGTGMCDFHSTSEHIATKDIYDTARLIIAICLARA